jgi:hypothetical protein
LNAVEDKESPQQEDNYSHCRRTRSRRSKRTTTALAMVKRMRTSVREEMGEVSDPEKM